MPQTHVMLCTHTDRHLRRTLLGISCQTERPASVVLSSDADDPTIGAAVEAAAREFGLPITYTCRPFQGAGRSSQVRNNAVRALLASEPDPESRLVFLDGDCCPHPEAVARHAASGSQRNGKRTLTVAFRVDLTPEQTEAFDEAAVRAGEPPATVTPEQTRLLDERDRRYRRAATLRRLGLGKPHKPKLLSANFSVDLHTYLDVNGFDEAYEHYGQEDDDFGRRVYSHGVRPVIGVRDILAYHQHHPTRAPGQWAQSPNAARFAEAWETRCAHGMQNPLAQDDPVITRFDVN